MSFASSRFAWLVLAVACMSGCNREVPVAETPPLEVVVSQAAPPGSEPNMIVDRDIYTGTVEAKDFVEIRSRVKGHIKDVLFTEGKEVLAGADLFLIDAEPFQADLKQAKGALETWQAKLKLAEDKIAIYKPLAEKGSISKEELLKAFADQGEAIGGIDAAKGKIMEAEINIGYCKIRSPIAGKVGEAFLTKGNLVNASGADSLLTTVIAVEPMYVVFYVNERAYQRYRNQLAAKAAKEPKAAKDKPLIIPLELSIGGDDTFPFKGVVDFVDNRVNPATASIKVRGKFENPKGPDDRRPLTAGAFARVRVTLGEPEPAILVADRAILTDQSLKYVLIVNKAKSNVVERVEVTVSPRLQENGLRQVLAGLKGDEWVIVEGVNRARPGITVAPIEGKMPRNPVK